MFLRKGLIYFLVWRQRALKFVEIAGEFHSMMISIGERGVLTVHSQTSKQPSPVGSVAARVSEATCQARP
jgi:hypothetical protein